MSSLAADEYSWLVTWQWGQASHLSALMMWQLLSRARSSVKLSRRSSHFSPNYDAPQNIFDMEICLDNEINVKRFRPRYPHCRLICLSRWRAHARRWIVVSRSQFWLIPTRESCALSVDFSSLLISSFLCFAFSFHSPFHRPKMCGIFACHGYVSFCPSSMSLTKQHLAILKSPSLKQRLYNV